LLTRVIKGGKENSVVSWSHFPLIISVRTSGKGTALSAIYNVNKTKVNEVIDVCGTLLLIPKENLLCVRQNQ